MAILPRVDRDYFIASTALPKFEDKHEPLNLNPNDLRDIFHEILELNFYLLVYYIVIDCLATTAMSIRKFSKEKTGKKPFTNINLVRI